MSTEDESWRKNFSNNEGGSRDGYRPSTQNSNRTSGTGRPMRPRITRSVYSSSGMNGEQRPRRPRISSGNNEFSRSAGTRSTTPIRREGMAPRREGGYTSRPVQDGTRSHFQRDTNAPRKPRTEMGGRPHRQRTADYNPHAKYSMKKQIEYKETHIDPDAPIRLNRFLANAGVCSRREADDFIAAGVISVNGQIVTELGTKVKRTDSVMFHNQPVSIEKKVYILLNKPKDYVTTSDDPQKRKTVMDLIKGACRERVYPVGRLDRNTTGVLLFTNDGELASKLTHPQFRKKKIYHVFCNKNVSPEDIQKIAEGIQLDDGEIHADAIEYASPTDKKQIGIEIHSGRNRIVRRIFESLGYKVVKLDRVLFAGLTKKNVKRGDWRFLTEQEVNYLRMGSFD